MSYILTIIFHCFNEELFSSTTFCNKNVIISFSEHDINCGIVSIHSMFVSVTAILLTINSMPSNMCFSLKQSNWIPVLYRN